MGFICTIRFCNELGCWVQPPDAENRMSGGVGGITGAIPLSPPDRLEVGMPDSRRFRVTGGTYFFTVNLLECRLDILGR